MKPGTHVKRLNPVTRTKGGIHNVLRLLGSYRSLSRCLIRGRENRYSTNHIFHERIKIRTLSMLTFLLFLAGCTLKLTTDLSKLVSVDSPKELMGTEEARQIAKSIGEGMGTKIMEGEVLATDIGEGLGEVFLEPQSVPIVTDPVSVSIIEETGIIQIKEGNYTEAIDSFKRTNNLPRLEEIALILFDRGNTREAADLHNYLIDRKWSLRPPYLVAKHIEEEGLAMLEKWEKEGISLILGQDKDLLVHEGNSEGTTVDLDAPLKEPEKGHTNQYSDLFDF